MVDVFTKKERSRIMAKIRSKNTKPELILRRSLYSKGLRYRIHYGKEKVDIAFPSRRLAVFVDGCFWHMCPKHGEFPTSNRRYWVPKLKRNAQRDRETSARLKKAGWHVVRIWEHDIRNNTKDLVSVITKKLSKLD